MTAKKHDEEPESVEPESEPEEVVHDLDEVDEPAPAEIVEVESVDDPDSPDAAEPLSDADTALLDEAATDLVADYREQAARAQAELVNFRNRVERDRAANRDAVIS